MLAGEIPSKILLFGEYTILTGSKALAVPYSSFFGQWSFASTSSELEKSSKESLDLFIQRDWSHLLDQEKFKQHLSQGLWFDSSIPQGFGVGSSGALVAAIYMTYGLSKNNSSNARQGLSELESFFHGSSSGIDPLVSYLNNPLLIHNFNQVETLPRPLSLRGFFLLNSGIPRKTGALVHIFQEKLKDENFKKNCQNKLSLDVNQAISSLLEENSSQVLSKFMEISKFQWDYFQEMIPKDLCPVWTRGLESGDYGLKLCGAGGGGFFLGYSPKDDFIGTKLGMKDQNIRWL